MTAAMLRSVLRRSAAASYASSRGFNSASTQERKVAILGAAGGIGQPLSLLMKLNPMVSSLALYDIAGTPGVAADVSHINTRSEATPQANLSADVIEVLTKRTQDGGTEVVEAKAGKGSTTLSMAYAGVTFADACLKGLNGVPNVVECSFVQSTIKSTITELPFFASKVRLGKNGIKGVLGLGPMTDFEVYPTAPSVYEPIQPTFRPLSPHLPIYKPQTSSTVSITNRISAIILTTVPLSYAFLTLKVGPICLANESVYQALHYASKLGPISLQITALAAVYHLVHGIHDVYLLFK